MLCSVLAASELVAYRGALHHFRTPSRATKVVCKSDNPTGHQRVRPAVAAGVMGAAWGCATLAAHVWLGTIQSHLPVRAAGRIAAGGWLYIYRSPSSWLMGPWPSYQYPPFEPLLHAPVHAAVRVGLLPGVEMLAEHQGGLGAEWKLGGGWFWGVWHWWGAAVSAGVLAWAAARIAGRRGMMLSMLALTVSVLGHAPAGAVLVIGFVLLAASADSDGRSGWWAALAVLAKQTGAAFLLPLAASRRHVGRFLWVAAVSVAAVMLPILAAEPAATLHTLTQTRPDVELPQSLWAAIIGRADIAGFVYRGLWLVLAASAGLWLRRVTGGAVPRLALLVSVLCLVAASRVVLFEAWIHFHYWAPVAVFGVLAAHLNGARVWPVLAASAGMRLWNGDAIDRLTAQLYEAAAMPPQAYLKPVELAGWWAAALALAAVMVWPSWAAVAAAHRERSDSPIRWRFRPSLPSRAQATALAVVGVVCIGVAALPPGAYLRITPAVLWDGDGLVVHSDQQRVFDDYLSDKTDLWAEDGGNVPEWLSGREQARHAALAGCGSAGHAGRANPQTCAALGEAAGWRAYWRAMLTHIDATQAATGMLRGYPDTGPLREALADVVDSLGDSWRSAWEALSDCESDCHAQQAEYNAREAAAVAAASRANRVLVDFMVARGRWLSQTETAWPNIKQHV